MTNGWPSATKPTWHTSPASRMPWITARSCDPRLGRRCSVVCGVTARDAEGWRVSVMVASAFLGASARHRLRYLRVDLRAGATARESQVPCRPRTPVRDTEIRCPPHEHRPGLHRLRYRRGGAQDHARQRL